jgi:hypothetical protein
MVHVMAILRTSGVIEGDLLPRGRSVSQYPNMPPVRTDFHIRLSSISLMG